MKTRMVAIICLLVIGISFLNHEYTSAQSSSPISKIGVVNIDNVMEKCNATQTYMQKAKAEIDALRAEQTKMKEEIQALESELGSGAYEVGSDKFYQKNRELAQKEKDMNFLGDYKQQELQMKNQLWQIELYNKIMKIAQEVGAEKDLYLVLSVEDGEMSAQRPDDFPISRKTRKVLYSGGCMDLTEIVTSRLNALK